MLKCFVLMEDIANRVLTFFNYFLDFTICIIRIMVYLKISHLSNDPMFFVCRSFLQTYSRLPTNLATKCRHMN